MVFGIISFKLSAFVLFPFRDIYNQYYFLGGSGGEESTCDAGDPGSIPGSGRSPGERNSNPLQYSCLENSMDSEEAGELHGVVELDMTE